MNLWDLYRARAAELAALAGRESDLRLRGEFEGLARSYLRLAEQAEQNSRNDIVYETPHSGDDRPKA